MVLKIIDRYIFKELLKVFVISVGALTMVLYLDKFLFMAEMIINRGVTLMEVARIMVYISPAFLALSIPMSVLVAGVVVFNQFSAHNEWVAMKSSRWSFLQLMRPVAYFSLISYILANLVMFYALPWGNQSYKRLIFDIIKHRVDFDIKPSVFNRDFKDLVVFVKEREGNNRLRDVFIADTTGRDRTPKIITAREGIVFSNPETFKIQLKLHKGTIHEVGKERKDYQLVNFNRYDITLSLPSAERLEKQALVGNRELSVSQLLERIRKMKAEGLVTWGKEVELSKKFSIPFTCLIFGLLGAPLGIKSSRSGRSGSFATSIAIIVLYYMFLVFSQNLGRIGKVNSYFSVWIPNLLFLGILIQVIFKMQKELPFKIFDRFTDLLLGCLEWLKNAFSSKPPAAAQPSGRLKEWRSVRETLMKRPADFFQKNLEKTRGTESDAG